MSTVLRVLVFALCCVLASPASAGFASSEVFLPDVGRLAGANQSQFYTTVWVTNLGSSTVDFSFEFLQSGQANPSPKSFTDTLSAGETKIYEDVVGQTLKLSSANGGARITATGDVFASERIYNLPAGANLSESAGQFYSGVPSSFAIGLGETASIQGVYLGSGKDFRYNYVLLETSGQSCKVHVRALDDAGNQLGASDMNLSPYEQQLLPAGALASTASSTNARISATVTSGTGKVLIAGSQVGNGGPQDQSGFEMSFKDSLLTTGNAGSGVTSLNGLVGAVSLIPGSNITLTTEGNAIRIAGAAGGLALPFSGSTTTSTPAFQVTNTNSTSTAIHAILGSPAQLSSPFSSSALERAALVAETNGGIGIVAAASGITGGTTLPFAIFSIADKAYGVYSVAVNGGPAIVAFSASGSSGSSGISIGQNAIAAGSNGSDPTIVVESDSTGAGNAIAATSEGTDPTITVENDSTGDGIDVTAAGGVGLRIDTTSGTSRSVDAKTSDQDDAAIFGSNDGGGGGGAGWGVQGEYRSGSGVAINDGYLGGANYGVFGIESGAGQTYGVLGEVTGSGQSFGVFGQSSSYVGTYGVNASSGLAGELGTPSYGVYAIGNLGATGMKPFVEPHPTDPSKEIRYVCLEGPEAGTYFRGTAHIVNGFATIIVPDHFRMVSSEEGLTIVTTPVGAPASLWVARQGLDKIVIQGSNDVEFHYMVNGIRKAFSDFQPISENRDFVPRSANDSMSVKALPAESVRRLKASGILKDDGSINMDTVRRLGWDKQPGWRNEASK